MASCGIPEQITETKSDSNDCWGVQHLLLAGDGAVVKCSDTEHAAAFRLVYVHLYFAPATWEAHVNEYKLKERDETKQGQI